MGPTLRMGARLTGGAVILGVLVWKLGSGPFVVGLGRVDGWSLVAAVLLAGVSTTCNAWRWVLVARVLGVPLQPRAALAACYRSQLLNSLLPGGVLGDVHRGLRHGTDTGARSAGLRAVLWERVLGQLVLVAAAALLLVLVPTPLPTWLRAVLGVAGAGLVVVAVTPGVWPLPRDLHALLGAPALGGVVPLSLGAVGCHVATFLVAARVVGVTAPTATVVVLGVLALLAMSLPLNVAGWGPREGVAAWAFAAVGLGAGQGVSTAVVYGVLGLVATLPGLVVLLLDRRAVATPRPVDAGPVGPPEPAEVGRG
ncbi:MAG: lysylphosphatidylglycerol synthase transmembrane domain-containing protein [Nocardioidaceae bacterium]